MHVICGLAGALLHKPPILLCADHVLISQMLVRIFVCLFAAKHSLGVDSPVRQAVCNA